MTRILMIDPASATGRVKTLFSEIEAERGRVPAMMRMLGHSPAALAGYLSFSSQLSSGVLPAALRERIAIAVAATNECPPCLAAHTAFGHREGLSAEELANARRAESEDPAVTTALRFALAVMRSVGHVPDRALADVRAAGYDDAAIMEIVATVFINVFTNAVNHVAGTIPDEPMAHVG